MIRSEGRPLVPFADEAHAVAAAIDIAESIGRTGRDAKVLLRTGSRTFRKLWTYGRDLYPNSLGRPHNKRVRGTYRLQ